MRYYIADPHFFHGALNTKMDRRGFESVEAMNEYMLRQWNRKVRKNDEVVILGDLSWGKAEETNELLERLNGRLYLIQGNHDRFLKNKDYNAGRFVWIKPYEELQDNKRKVILCHYPIMCYNGQYRVDENARQIPCNMINCFCMYSDYVPLTLDEWIACEKRRME